MFQGFQPFKVETQTDPPITICGLKSGDGSSSSSSSPSRPPLLLLHGFPQTRHIWHRVAPKLVDQYTVVLMDLRGYGESSKPEHVASYAKSAMARDCVKVMDELGFKQSFFVCAHDRGARVAHKLCVDFPDRVRKAILLDICPTLAMYTKTDFDFAKAYFHWFFLIQPDPLPETLISGCPREFAELFMGGRQKDGLHIFDSACFDTYVENFKDAATVHAMCQDYRASATLDLDEAREDLEKSRLVRCPLLILWGKHGVIEKCFDALEEWRAVTESGVSVTGNSVDSGHYLPENVPEEVTSAIGSFLV
ncbi:Alpha/Beta hydrolase protein [Thelonectria olida]|uniref:Alpha/Beta hydrolase protein n=1 Tax=Thelonectria olida TaxID=1576542 RepID=A0A9P9AQF6_9HYPO|nr:Alpha/Beta hydrolase protein [Thelonectria olida]